MGYEIDYIPVGNGESSGDAILLRFGNLTSNPEAQNVILIDGGYKPTGIEIIKHINQYYHTNHIDIVISTHPDRDHASGLSEVLENCDVGILLMHRPWAHEQAISLHKAFGRITSNNYGSHLEKSLTHAKTLEEIAIRKGIAIIEPFSGTNFIPLISGKAKILGPSIEYYEALLPQFFSQPLTKSVDEIKYEEDAPDKDLLNDDNSDTTSVLNLTSTIMYFEIDGSKFLFTGDAGKGSLLQAIKHAQTNNLTLNDLNLLDVPHHGSKRNLNSNILKYIKAKFAFISAPGTIKHPAKKVTNALIKNGMDVYVASKLKLSHRQNAPDRKWVKAPKVEFQKYVEV